MTGEQGHIYLIHFEQPFKHARHYLGYARSISARLKRHRTGKGARLMAAVAAAGIGFKVVRTWWGDRARERQMHVQSDNKRWCPVCRGEVTYEAVEPPKRYLRETAWRAT